MAFVAPLLERGCWMVVLVSSSRRSHVRARCILAIGGRLFGKDSFRMVSCAIPRVLLMRVGGTVEDLSILRDWVKLGTVENQQYILQPLDLPMSGL